MAVPDRTGQVYRSKPRRGPSRLVRVIGKDRNKSAERGQTIWSVEVLEGATRGRSISANTLNLDWILQTEKVSETVASSKPKIFSTTQVHQFRATDQKETP